MLNLGRSLVNMLIIVALLSVVIGIAQATIASLTIKAGEEVTHPINLIAEDRVLIQYKFVEGNTTAIQFSISFPNGTISALFETNFAPSESLRPEYVYTFSWPFISFFEV